MSRSLARPSWIDCVDVGKRCRGIRDDDMCWIIWPGLAWIRERTRTHMKSCSTIDRLINGVHVIYVKCKIIKIFIWSVLARARLLWQYSRKSIKLPRRTLQFTNNKFFQHEAEGADEKLVEDEEKWCDRPLFGSRRARPERCRSATCSLPSHSGRFGRFFCF